MQYHLNLVGPPGCGILDGGFELVPEGLLQLLTLRPFLANNGGVVLPEALRGPTGDLYRYGLERGLTDEGARKRVLWVPDYWSYLEVLGYLKRQRLRVDFYQGAPALGELFGQVCVQGWRAAQIAEGFSNKARFKRLIDQLSAQLGVAVNRYPRVVVDCRDGWALANAVTSLYGEGHRVLFGQGAVGAGGFRNLTIDLGTRTVVAPSGTRSFEDFGSLAGIFRELCPLVTESPRAGVDDQEGDTPQYLWELSPLLPIEMRKSFSFGLTLTDNGVIVAGPRYQLLGDKLDYRGFYASESNLPPDADMVPDPDFARVWSEVLANAKTLAGAFGHRLHAGGYRGPCSVDFFVYPNGEGGYALGVAEANMRRDGTSFLLSLLASVGHLSRFKAIQCLDHVEVPDATLPELIERLERHKVPLFSRLNSRGAILLTAPIADGDGHFVCAGFTEESPARLEALVSQFERAVAVKKVALVQSR